MKKKISLIVLCAIVLISVCGCSNINSKEIEKLEQNFNGNWQLTTYVDGVKQNIKIENASLGCAGDATPCIHKNSQLMIDKNIVFEEHSGNELYVCFELYNDNMLVQVNCEDDEVSEYSKYNYVKKIGIIYKKSN